MRIAGTGRTQAQIDATQAKQDAEDRTRRLQAYLDATDRYVARSVETGEAMHQTTLDRRAKARQAITRLRTEHKLSADAPEFPEDALPEDMRTT